MNDFHQSQNSVGKMTEEEKIRTEAPDEEPEEKKGFFRPLPEKEEKRYVDKDGRPQPIVKLLGFSMRDYVEFGRVVQCRRAGLGSRPVCGAGRCLPEQESGR